MIKSAIKILIVVLCCFLSINRIGALECVEFENGDGTESNPFIIKTPLELYSISCNLNSYFELANNIDMEYDTTNEEGLFYNDGNGWEPIGNSNYPFKGHLDGKNYSISGLYSKSSTYAALFGEVKGTSSNKAVIKNLKLKNIIIRSSSTGYAGGLVAKGTYVDIINIGIEASEVNSNSMYTGGLVGYGYYCNIVNSYNSSNIIGSYSTGGLVGHSIDSEISNSYNLAKIRGTYFTGGIVGSAEYTNINNCFNSGNVVGGKNNNGPNNVGGIVGKFYNSSSIDKVISYGVVMELDNYLKRKESNNFVSPIIGEYKNEVVNNIKNAFYFNQYGVLTNEFGIELKKNELTNTSKYTEFDFDSIWTTNNEGLPVLRIAETTSIEIDNKYFQTGNGSSDNPFIISTPVQLDAIRYDLTGYYLLSNNIDLTYDTANKNGIFYNNGSGWNPIGTSTIPFGGTLNGNGYSIIGLKMLNIGENNDGKAFFKKTNNASILNVSFLNININSMSRGDSCSCITLGDTDSIVDNIIITGSIKCSYVSSVGNIEKAKNIMNYSSVTIKEFDNHGNGDSYGIAHSKNIENSINYGYVDGEPASFGTSERYGIGTYKDSIIINNSINIGNVRGQGGISGITNWPFETAFSIDNISNVYDIIGGPPPIRQDGVSNSNNETIYENSLLGITQKLVNNHTFRTIGDIPILSNIETNMNNIYFDSITIEGEYHKKIDFNVQQIFDNYFSNKELVDQYKSYDYIEYESSCFSYNKESCLDNLLNSNVIGTKYYSFIIYGNNNTLILNTKFVVNPLNVSLTPKDNNYLSESDTSLTYTRGSDGLFLRNFVNSNGSDSIKMKLSTEIEGITLNGYTLSVSNSFAEKTIPIIVYTNDYDNNNDGIIEELASSLTIYVKIPNKTEIELTGISFENREYNARPINYVGKLIAKLNGNVLNENIALNIKYEGIDGTVFNSECNSSILYLNGACSLDERPKNIGKYKVTISTIDDSKYKGLASFTFEIIKSSAIIPDTKIDVIGYKSLKFSFDKIDNVQGYEIEVKNGSKTSKHVITKNDIDNKFDCTKSNDKCIYIEKNNLSNKTYFRIRTYTIVDGAYYYSDYSDNIRFNNDMTPPVASISKGSNNSLKLSWSIRNNTSKYIIYRSSNGKRYSKIKEVDSNVFIDKGLSYGVTYYYKIIANNLFAGKTKYSNVVKKKVIPNKVENLMINNITDDSIQISFDKVVVNGYEIYVGTSKEKMKKIKTITKNSTTTFNKTKLKANTKYFFKVRAYKNVSGKKVYGAWSEILHTKTAPAKPTLKVSLKDYNAMNVTIGESKGSVKYRLEKSLDGKTYALVEDFPNKGTVAQETQEVGKMYYFRVRACNSENRCSGWTIVSLKQTPKAPGLTLSTTSNKVIISLNCVH